MTQQKYYTTTTTFGNRPNSEDIVPGPRRKPRGLDALLPPATADLPLEVPIQNIVPNRLQPRQRFDQQELAELASSIAEHGMLQPLLVRELSEGSFELIAGERRWRAAHLANQKSVPVMVRPVSSEERRPLLLALVENLQRSDLNPLEAASAFDQLLAAGWTQERIAQSVGKSRAAIANSLRLLRLPDVVQSMVNDGLLSEGHGRALLGAAKPQQEALATRAVERGWSVRELERAVRDRSQPDEEAEPASEPAQRVEPAVSSATEAAVERMRSALGAKVDLRVGKRGPSAGGRLVIHWSDEAELQALASQFSDVLELPDIVGQSDD